MASAPTQQLPSWLSYSTTTITNSAGLPVSTSRTLLELPLTYYGPSIPLGSDGVWVYGGLSSPASSASASSISTSTTPITSSSTNSQSSSTSSYSPSATSVVGSSPAFKTSYIGAIVGSIVAAVVIILFGLLFLRCSRGRRRRLRSGHDLLTPQPERRSRHSRISVALVDEPTSPSDIKELPETIWTGWSMVHSGSQAENVVPPVEGDWTMVEDHGRSSGDRSRGNDNEGDSFLRRSTHATSVEMAQSNASARLVNVPSHPSVVDSSTHNSADSASTGQSGYGMVVDPSDSRFSTPPPATQFGHILPPSVLLRIADETPGRRQESTIEEQDEHSSLLLPPPPLDPDRSYSQHSRDSVRTMGSSQYPDTPHSWDEIAQLMTAQKVRIDEMGRADARHVPSPAAGPSRILSGPLAAIGRMSWLRRISAGAESVLDRPRSHLGVFSITNDIETASLSPDRLRPVSGASARSDSSNGGSVYHDARSRPETPVLMHPPVAVTSSRSRLGMTNTIAEEAESPSVRIVNSPPSYDDTLVQDTASSTVRDVLDSPAPRPASPFASSSTTGRTAVPTCPPGLTGALSLQKSFSTFNDNFSNGTSSGIVIDVLEDEPPAAQELWRSLAGGSDQRATFGAPPMYVHPGHASHSEQGSLSSMRSHLSPRSVSNASGSNPSSFIHHSAESSAGTGSSRRTRGSSGASLAYSGSVSSDGRRRRRQAGGPNAPGAFGRVSVGATGVTATSLLGSRPSSSPSPTNPRFGGATFTSIPGSVDRVSDITTEAIDPITGTLLQLPGATVGR